MNRKTFAKNYLLLLAAAVMVIGFFSCKKADGIIEGSGKIPVGANAPDFIEQDIDGNTFSLQDLRGRVILLNFSVMGSEPCQWVAPELMEIFNTYKDQGLEVVQVINRDEDGNSADPGDLERWARQYNLAFTLLNDPDGSTVETYTRRSYPTNLIIDRDFKVRYYYFGFISDAITRKIEELL